MNGDIAITSVYNPPIISIIAVAEINRPFQCFGRFSKDFSWSDMG